MFVWCESFHGIRLVASGTDLLSIYGINNIGGLAGFASINVSENVDNGQPGIVLQNNLGSGPGNLIFLRMGPGIVGNENWTSRSKWYYHFAYVLHATSQVGSDLLYIEDVTVFPNPMIQCVFAVKNNGPSGNSFVLKKPDQTILAETPNFNQEGVYYFQLHVEVGNAGASRLIISGIEQWNVTGIDTQSTANNTANAVSFCNTSFTRVSTFSNVVIADDRADGLTPPFNDLMGEFVVIKIQPNAPGDNAELTPVGAAANWDTINDYPNPDDDSTYNESIADTAQDVVNYEDIGPIFDNPVFGVNLRTKARKTEAGPRVLTHIIKPTTIEYDGYTHSLLTTYEWFSDCYDKNPDTNVRYTKSEIDNHQWGYRAKVTP